jgi:hypothetical protein
MKKEIERVAESLIMSMYGDQRYMRAVFTYNEEYQFKMLSFSKTGGVPEKDIQNNILCWCNRLWWSNQLAYMMTYGHHEETSKTITDIDDEHLPSSHPVAKMLYDDLKAIEYNLISNGGRKMISAEDERKLEDLISIVSGEIIRATEA